MIPTPVWFGGEARPIFGWFAVPDRGTACAGVVLCPPFAVETASAKPTLRALAERLVEAGCAVLTFDYDGTGNSFGSDGDPDRLATWKSNIRQAIDFVADAGCPQVAVVGLRLGATIAAAELQDAGTDVDAAVLWDPCASGRSFLREQSLIRKLIDRGEILDDGSVEAPGMVFPPEAVAELGQLQLDGRGVAEHTLVLTRANRPLAERVVTRIDGPEVEWQSIDGQDLLVDVEPARTVIPEATVELIATWLGGRLAGATKPIQVPEPGPAIVGHTPGGKPITEQPVWLGPHRLFGIETLPATASAAPPVLLLNAGAMDHVGPARTWVTMARALAAMGLRSVRFDLSGIGGSPLRPGAEERSTRTLEGLEDVRDAQRALSPDDPSNVIIVGLCSGGYHGSEAALSTGARCLVMINPSFRLGTLSDEPTLSAPIDGDSDDKLPEASLERQAVEAPRGWVGMIPGRSVLWQLVRRSPDRLWTLINRLAVAHPASDTLRRLSTSGVEVLVACDDHDAWVLQRGANHALSRPAARRMLRVEIVEGMDHTLFCRDARDRTLDLVEEYLDEHFGGTYDAGPAGTESAASCSPTRSGQLHRSGSR